MIGMAKVGGAMFFLSALSASLCGWLSDRWIAAGGSPTRALKSFMAVAGLSMGVFLMGAVLSPGNLGIAFLMLTGIAFGLGSSNLWVITQRLAGREAVGRWCGIQLFVGNSAGVVAPAVTGFLLDRTGHFFWPFLIVSAFLWFGVFCWTVIIGPVEPVDWTRAHVPPTATAPAYTH
jgi:MFS transporter, ACS family, D-galactonate transporter